MAKQPITTVAEDFTGVVDFLTAKGIIPLRPPRPLLTTAAQIHRATYSLILWRFRIKSAFERCTVFLDEIASDALQILPHALQGFTKTTRLLIRGVVENTLRHVYFSDHPVEFARMNSRAKWYLGVDDLFANFGFHPLYDGLEAKFDAVNKLKTLYDDLSATVHGRRVVDLEMRIALNKINFDQASFEATASLVDRCAVAANFLLAVFHRDALHHFVPDDRKAILHTLPPQARAICADFRDWWMSRVSQTGILGARQVS